MKIFKHLYYKFFCNKIIKYHIDYKRDKCDDRNILESVIFPFILAEFDPQSILDIGREGYQEFYNDFFTGRDLWTLDYEPKHEEFGSPDKHIVDSVVNLSKHFKKNQFDFILMNGVFGWGLNDEKDIQKTFNDIFEILKPGGIFVLGYNDDIVPLEKITGLKKLRAYKFKPLKTNEYVCSNGNHTYNFYIK
ncbi:hypothetical protein C0583_05045 [Candidatus Parcubacteria bacterium]|nr:MAG: hypothetical protein C0583_05045 [Candidatus Parcubacteria bacterium]